MRSILLFLFFVGTLPTIIFNAYCGVILWSWWSFMSPQRLSFGFTSDFPFAIILAIVTLPVWLFSRQPKRLPSDASVWLVVALMFSFTVTTVFAIAPDVAYTKWLATEKALLFVVITAVISTNRIRIHALIWTMVISISFYGTKSGVGALISGGNSTAWGPDGTAISDNNHFALALLVTIPLINYIRLNSALRAIQIGAAAVMGLCLIAVLASYSRGALLGLIAIGGFLWLKSKAKILPAVAIVIVLFGAISLMPSRWLDRMNSIDQYSEDGSAQGRLTMWHAAVAIAAKRPLGAGFLGPYSQDVVDLYDPGTRARAVHSIYFEVIGEHGFAVFALWMLVPLFAWRNGSWIISHTRDRPDMKWAGDAARMLQVSLIGYLVGGAFLSLSYWDIYFTLVAILAAVRNIVASGVPAPLPQPVGPGMPLFARVAPRVGSATSRR